jgi:glucose/mannose-6-phosphate isomerase
MLDDMNVISQRDPSGALGIAAKQPEQAKFAVVAGMGGSALAALLVRMWLKAELRVPFEVIRSYDLPGYVNEHTLVIASSYSGNTEETVSALQEAEDRGAQVAVIDAGGILAQSATEQKIAYADMPAGLQPRMAVIYNLRALVALLVNFNVVAPERLDDIAATSQWLTDESAQWIADISTDKNYAKQLALQAVGKTGVFYGGTLTAPLAYKWKISWNENAKNVSWSNEYSEVNHNEFIGWTSHPIEKPFAIFDLISPLEHPQILKRFEISDRLLSGMRPKATTINLKGETLLEQLLWGSILADFVSIYLAILNHVDPTPVPLIEKLKIELIA